MVSVKELCDRLTNATRYSVTVVTDGRACGPWGTYVTFNRGGAKLRARGSLITVTRGICGVEKQLPNGPLIAPMSSGSPSGCPVRHGIGLIQAVGLARN